MSCRRRTQPGFSKVRLCLCPALSDGTTPAGPAAGGWSGGLTEGAWRSGDGETAAAGLSDRRATAIAGGSGRSAGFSACKFGAVATRGASGAAAAGGVGRGLGSGSTAAGFSAGAAGFGKRVRAAGRGAGAKEVDENSVWRLLRSSRSRSFIRATSEATAPLMVSRATIEGTLLLPVVPATTGSAPVEASGADLRSPPLTVAGLGLTGIGTLLPL